MASRAGSDTLVGGGKGRRATTSLAAVRCACALVWTRKQTTRSPTAGRGETDRVGEVRCRVCEFLGALRFCRPAQQVVWVVLVSWLHDSGKKLQVPWGAGSQICLATDSKMADKTKLIRDLRERVAHLPPLPDEPEFSTSEDTLVRYLKSRDWKLEEAAQMLTDTIEYRRRIRPQTLDCSWCHNNPGFHSMRQVGNDEAGRPVLYSSFVQAATHRNTADDSVTHVSYLIENAKRTMAPGVSTWVFIVDCTGMTLGACNPKLGYDVYNVVSNHYPERLGMMVCINHSRVFHGVWTAMKTFLHPNTVAKVKLVRTKAKMAELFSHLFSAELSDWLQEEVALNKQKPLPKTQTEFWNPPESGGVHDPRGCPTYVRKYLEGYQKTLKSNCGVHKSGNAAPPPEQTAPVSEGGRSSEVAVRVHKPHPNVVSQLSGQRVKRMHQSREEEQDRQREQDKASQREGDAEGEDGDLACDLEIPRELQIPPTALPVNASS